MKQGSVPRTGTHPRTHAHAHTHAPNSNLDAQTLYKKGACSLCVVAQTTKSVWLNNFRKIGLKSVGTARAPVQPPITAGVEPHAC